MSPRPARLALSVLGLVSLATAGLAQTDATPSFVLPATNPPAAVKQRLASTEIEIRYNRPSVKGRRIFGGLVPFGQIWRTGSDSATRISFSTPVKVNGAAIDAGTYELFTIPDENQWTVIVHKNQSQWGSYTYDEKNDVARVIAIPVPTAGLVENFTIGINDIHSSSATLNLVWEKTRVPVEISVDIRATVVPELDAALKAEGRKPYFLAAMFYFEHDLDIARAAELMALALEGSPGHIGMLHRQALILAKKGDREGAIAAAEKSLAGAQTAARELRDEYTRLNTALLEKLRK